MPSDALEGDITLGARNAPEEWRVYHMSLTRKLLKGMGLTEEQVDTVIEAHTDTVDGLKEQIATYKADAEKLSSVQTELDALKGGEDWKAKYEAEHAAFDKYKADVASQENAAKVKDAYRALLKECKLKEDLIDKAVKMADLSSVKLDKDGKLEKVDELTEAIKSDWAGYIETSGTKGAHVDNPPSGGGKATKTREEIMAIKDTAERQKAIAENPEVFGIKL